MPFPQTSIENTLNAIEVAYERGIAAVALEPKGMVDEVRAHIATLESHLAAARRERDEARGERDALLKFVGKAFDESRGDNVGCDWDGAEIQSAMWDCGLLVEVTEHAPCDPERCVCAETGEFPLTCLRASPLGLKAIAAASPPPSEPVVPTEDPGSTVCLATDAFAATSTPFCVCPECATATPSEPEAAERASL